MKDALAFLFPIFFIVLISPGVQSAVLLSQESVTLKSGDSYAVSGHSTDYNITVRNISESDARLEIDGEIHTISNESCLIFDGGRLAISLDSLIYNKFLSLRKVNLAINTSCIPECDGRDCGESSNGCGDCGSCRPETEVCDEGYCIGIVGEYALRKNEQVRLKTGGKYYVVNVTDVARVLAKISIDYEEFNVFRGDRESMNVSKDGLAIEITSITYEENYTNRSTVSFTVKSPIEGCVPDCTCEEETCIGDSCSDGCGGLCAGKLGPDCSTVECGISPNGCGTCDEPGCPLHMRCNEGICVLWECMPYIMTILILVAVIIVVTYIAIKRKPYRTPSMLLGVKKIES